MKKLLVIGGSYFVGRVFAVLASQTGEYELCLVNRGRFSMTHLSGVRELRCDRKKPQDIQKLPAEDFDAIVDFCAYEPGDISMFLDNYPGKAKQYIFVSTADVYESGSAMRDESAPLQTVQTPGPVGEYTFKKALLEGELRSCCGDKGLEFTILRPAFIYGPFNYAPRESWYVKNIVEGRSIPVPVDSSSKFSLVYAGDVARAIMACVGNLAAKGEAFNLAGPEELDYGSFMAVLKEASDLPFDTYPVTAQQVLEQNIPLPFPLFEEENELFSGVKAARELGISYTPISEGMKKTYNAFRPVYEGR